MNRTPDSAGFSLIEILVALALIGLAAGALVPAVVNQISKGETNRVVEDLTAIEGAIKAFRVDMQRWPSGVRNLVTQPTGSDTDLNGTAYPGGLLARWGGPYLERGALPGDTIPTANGGVVLPTFTSEDWGGTDFVTVKVKGITEEGARRVSLVVDGDVEVNTTGRIRWEAGDGEQVPDMLVFFATPIR